MPSQTFAEPAQSFSQPPPIFTKSGLAPSECLLLDPCAFGNTPRSSFSETATQRRWEEAAKIPVLVSSRDFVAVTLQWQAKAAAVRRDVEAAKGDAAKLVSLSQETGQHPFAKLIITVQAKEAEAFAAEAAGDADGALAKLREAVAIEDSIDDLSQPPYPVIPATELAGNLLLDFNRPAEATPYSRKTLQRTPNRPKAILGLARAAQATGDNATAMERYHEFLTVWKDADLDRPEVATAKEFLAKKAISEK